MADHSRFWAVFQHVFPLIITKILRNNFVFLLHGFIFLICLRHNCLRVFNSLLKVLWALRVWERKISKPSQLFFRWPYLSCIYQVERAPEDWYPFWSNAEVFKKIGQQVQKVRCILARALNIEFLSPAEEGGLGWGTNKAFCSRGGGFQGWLWHWIPSLGK